MNAMCNVQKSDLHLDNHSSRNTQMYASVNSERVQILQNDCNHRVLEKDVGVLVVNGI
jgi:hypothetical protein